MNDDKKPAFELDLENCSNKAFQDVLDQFYNWSDTQPELGPLGLPSGWHTVDWRLAEEFLRRNECNREVSLATVRKYLYSMQIGDWKKTGQGLVFNTAGEMNEGQHRCIAAYFGRVEFDTFIVTDAPVEEDLFAYYDDIKPRTAADALQTSGVDGIAQHLVTASLLSYRYENDAIGILKQPKIHKPTVRETLAYTRIHEDLAKAAHLLLGNFGSALRVIGNKGVAIFFSERVIALFGHKALESFLVPLGSGANLEEGSPILGLRNRLLTNDGINKERILALVIKAFNYFHVGKKLPKRGLALYDNDKFPRLESVEVENND